MYVFVFFSGFFSIDTNESDEGALLTTFRKALLVALSCIKIEREGGKRHLRKKKSRLGVSSAAE